MCELLDKYSIFRWKIHESIMLAVGSVRTLIVESIEENKIQLDLNGFLTNVVLADLNMSGK